MAGAKSSRPMAWAISCGGDHETPHGHGHQAAQVVAVVEISGQILTSRAVDVNETAICEH